MNNTRWVVISGAPASGKTAVIEALARRGYNVLPEAARAVIERKMQAGLTLAAVRADNKRLQQDILQEKQTQERGLDAMARVFLDRGMGDSLSYFRLAGMETAEAEAAAQLYRYDAVFIFDRLPLVHDSVRDESEAVAQRLDHDLESDYRALGYDPVRVPVMPIEARADFILQALGEKHPVL